MAPTALEDRTMKAPEAPSSLGKLFWTALLAVALVLTWTDVLQERSDRFATEGLKRAGTVYLTARTINAAISVLQETQFSVTPAGVGVQLALGQWLDPVNDAV